MLSLFSEMMPSWPTNFFCNGTISPLPLSFLGITLIRDALSRESAYRRGVRVRTVWWMRARMSYRCAFQLGRGSLAPLGDQEAQRMDQSEPDTVDKRPLFRLNVSVVRMIVGVVKGGIETGEEGVNSQRIWSRVMQRYRGDFRRNDPRSGTGWRCCRHR